VFYSELKFINKLLTSSLLRLLIYLIFEQPILVYLIILSNDELYFTGTGSVVFSRKEHKSAGQNYKKNTSFTKET